MKTITGIHGVPRSGTSWLAQIFNASPSVNLKFQPLFSFAFKDYLCESSSSEEIDDFFEKINKSNDYFISMKDEIIHKNYPVFYKENKLDHLVFKHVRYHNLLENMLDKNEQIKFIFLLRNPFAVLSSWKKAPKEFNPDWNFDLEWKFAENKNEGRVEEYFGYNKWKEASRLFLYLKKKYPKRVTTIVYNVLLHKTEIEARRLFKFAEIPFSKSILDFIYDSKSKSFKDNNSVYRIKKKDDSWKRVINSNIQNIIENDLKCSELEFLL